MMFPGIYDFRWDAGHVLFLGAFYAVVLLLFGALGVAIARAFRDLRSGKAEAIRWAEDFGALPKPSRACRHEITGEVARRTCDLGFDCGRCPAHAAFLAAGDPPPPAAGRTGIVELAALGIQLPPGRLHHRGHTWVKPLPDGTVTVGLDDLAARLVGTPDEVRMPEPGTRVVANGTAWRMRKGKAEVRVLCPVNGRVIETGSPFLGYYLRIRPEVGAADGAHLLRGAEVRAWILREVDRLQALLSNGRVGGTFTDGGLPVRNLSRAIPEEERDAILGEVFLDP